MGRLLFILGFWAALAAPAAAKTDREIEFAAEIAEAEKLGRIIFEYDIAAWVATDSLIGKLGGLEDKVTGWVRSGARVPRCCRRPRPRWRWWAAS